jgi:hypothetical protein
MADFFALATAPLLPSNDELVTMVIEVLRGVTGMPPGLIRPRWQPKAPNWPAEGIDWVSVGVVRTVPSDYGGQTFSDEKLVHQQHLTVECLLSIYGPSAVRIAGVVRAGLQMTLNQDAIHGIGLAVQDVGATTTLSEEVNSVFIPRLDLPVQFRMVMSTTYNVPEIRKSGGTIEGPVPSVWSVGG